MHNLLNCIKILNCCFCQFIRSLSYITCLSSSIKVNDSNLSNLNKVKIIIKVFILQVMDSNNVLKIRLNSKLDKSLIHGLIDSTDLING